MASHGIKRKRVDCAGCVVYRMTPGGMQVLLIKPRPDFDAWGIPKGHRDPEDKTLVDCAIRETYEETGLACMPEARLEPVWTRNPNEIKCVHAYLARHMGDEKPDPITKSEVDDIRWFSIDNLPVLHRYQVPLMQEAVHVLYAMMGVKRDS